MDASSPSSQQPSSSRFKPVVLAATAAFLSVNIWTGAPLLALWIGSRAQARSGSPSMGAVALVVLVLAVLVAILAYLLTRVGAAYDVATDAPKATRQVSPWLRSMRGEREDVDDRRRKLGAMDRVAVVSVVLAATAFNVWFFLLSGSSIPNA